MSTANNKKRMKTQEDPNEDDPIVFKVLHGTLKASDYATFNLLVPEDSIEGIAEALRGAKNSLFAWTIGDDEITDIQTVPAMFAHPIRSLDKIPTDKSESDLLDWLIHGESFSSKKYIIMMFVDPNRIPSTGEYAFEVESNSEHMKKLVDALDKISDVMEDVDCTDTYLQNYRVIDRGQFLREFDDCKVVDDALIEELESYATEAYDILRVDIATDGLLWEWKRILWRLSSEGKRKCYFS